MELFKHVSLIAAVAIGLTTSLVLAEEPTGTLKKIIDNRKIRLGYQKDLAPFSSAGADRTILASFARSARDPEQLVIADYQFMYQPYALPLRRNDADFKFAVNTVAANLYHGGEVLKIYRRWFGDLTPPPLLESLYDLNGLRD